ncbi:MAG TPA: CsgE family curli-type amyloid fiber assembly protein [Chryseosolibacter sp.]|nr:CsgE family curli-type amyloid fiber assembly protein [Chryseosolibacter sp.]
MIFQFLLICLALSASAQELDSGVVAEGNIITPDGGPTPAQNGVEIEIGQLIIDNTFSKTGSDFQQIFNTRWTWPMQPGEQFLITVSERPSILNSTLIEIAVNDLKVFESFLQPRYDVVEELATQAIDVTLQYILNYENTVKEMEGDDVSGSGIY